MTGKSQTDEGPCTEEVREKEETKAREKERKKKLREFGSGFGHDKSLEIRKYSKLPENERPYLFYAGDGVSDLSAAKETDMMFAKTGRGELYLCRPFH